MEVNELSDNTEEQTVTFSGEKLERLKKAETLFEADTNKPIELTSFIDMLVETYLSYRNMRGATESNLLQKLTGNP